MANERQEVLPQQPKTTIAAELTRRHPIRTKTLKAPFFNSVFSALGINEEIVVVTRRTPEIPTVPTEFTHISNFDVTKDEKHLHAVGFDGEKGTQTLVRDDKELISGKYFFDFYGWGEKFMVKTRPTDEQEGAEEGETLYMVDKDQVTPLITGKRFIAPIDNATRRFFRVREDNKDAIYHVSPEGQVQTIISGVDNPRMIRGTKWDYYNIHGLSDKIIVGDRNGSGFILFVDGPKVEAEIPLPMELGPKSFGFKKFVQTEDGQVRVLWTHKTEKGKQLYLNGQNLGPYRDSTRLYTDPELNNVISVDRHYAPTIRLNGQVVFKDSAFDMTRNQNISLSTGNLKNGYAALAIEKVSGEYKSRGQYILLISPHGVKHVGPWETLGYVVTNEDTFQVAGRQKAGQTYKTYSVNPRLRRGFIQEVKTEPLTQTFSGDIMEMY